MSFWDPSGLCSELPFLSPVDAVIAANRIGCTSTLGPDIVPQNRGLFDIFVVIFGGLFCEV